jgi:hypothetical protein
LVGCIKVRFGLIGTEERLKNNRWTTGNTQEQAAPVLFISGLDAAYTSFWKGFLKSVIETGC